MFHHASPRLEVFVLLFGLSLPAAGLRAQPPAESADPVASNQVAADQVAADKTKTIIVHTGETPPKLPALFTARAESVVRITPERADHLVTLQINVVQGEPETFSLELFGAGEVKSVEEDQIQSWSVRQEGSRRFLELHASQPTQRLKPRIRIESSQHDLPATVELAHLGPGQAIGFDSVVNVDLESAVTANVKAADGFAPLRKGPHDFRFQSSTGGRIEVLLRRSSALPGPIRWTDVALTGQVDQDTHWIPFQYRAKAHITQPDVKVTVLSGAAAIARLPQSDDYRLLLGNLNGSPQYQLIFPKPGVFDVELDFVAAVNVDSHQQRRIDFTIAASAVVPITIDGLPREVDFFRGPHWVVPQLDDSSWVGFLPATGRAKIGWKRSQHAGEGKLFFSTTGKIECQVGAGLLRQDHQIDYQVLQGELTTIGLELRGPGQILDVRGDNKVSVVGWKVLPQEKEESRRLEVTISQPIQSQAKLRIRSQTPLEAFPVRVQAMSIVPIGALRHSGYVRVTNSGSVRVEPAGLMGLAQLAPEKFPGRAIKSRQAFVYRFPTDDYGFELAADRTQPEVSVSTVSLYQLSDTDRVIQSDIELDIREAAIGNWDLLIPADYSVVSVTGSSVADYVVASEPDQNHRNLKVIFGSEVIGRQLISLHLEKNEAASSSPWQLPRIDFPDAKAVRGDVAVSAAAGLRVSIDQAERLSEKPLSSFPKGAENLQQAFRIRDRQWSATMQIEKLDRSIQADVFHLYSLSQDTVYGSVLINYFVTGAPVSQWKITVPESLGNIDIDGQDIRAWRQEGDQVIVSLHQPVMGAYTLLVTFEEKPTRGTGKFDAGKIAPLDARDEQGYIQVVSPMQVDLKTDTISDDVLRLDPLELPAEFRLLSTAPPLGTWQYTQRPFNLNLDLKWFAPGTTADQIIEFSEANSRVSRDGQWVSDIVYFVKSRDQTALKLKLPEPPVRLWEVSVNGIPVTARQSDGLTLVPLPGESGPSQPVEVRLRMGKPAINENRVRLALPTVDSPVMKTQWNVIGDEKRVLVPRGGTVAPADPVIPETGFTWIARHAPGRLVMMTILVVLAALFSRGSRWSIWFAMVNWLAALSSGVLFCWSSWTQLPPSQPLSLSLPILAAGESVELDVQNASAAWANVSITGLALAVLGLAGIVAATVKATRAPRIPIFGLAGLLIGIGMLMQHDHGSFFFALFAVAVLASGLFVHGKTWMRTLSSFASSLRRKEKRTTSVTSDPASAVTSTLLWLTCILASMTGVSPAAMPDGYGAADLVTQQWQIDHADKRLSGKGTIKVSGRPGDRFVLLHSPATLTKFDGDGLQVTKANGSDGKMVYLLSIPADELPDTENIDTENVDEPIEGPNQVRHDRDPKVVNVSVEEKVAQFEFQVEAIDLAKGVPILSGWAAVQEIDLSLDQPDWKVNCASAVQIQRLDSDPGQTRAKVLLGTGESALGHVTLHPKARDLSAEELRFFVEASHLYVPSSGVVDGHHALNVRVAQGQLEQLNVDVPVGLTVSSVEGPVSSWQFDAAKRLLKMAIGPAQSGNFTTVIKTQRPLDRLPTNVELEPLRVEQASGEVGLVAVAFGSDVQPEKLTAQGMSAVNTGDFDSPVLKESPAVLHRVFRYGVGEGKLTLRAGPVAPEVRAITRQVISLGDERVVSNIQLTTEISRSGLFQLSFELPEGTEIESLTGSALHHWSELSEKGKRTIVMHLNGKTIGSHPFSLTLSATPPSHQNDWLIPRFELNQATRQTGQLIVQPTTGIRLRSITRTNVSETDPRHLGSKSQGALAFRLLQKDWSLSLAIEKLTPWVSGNLLHQVVLREGQTRSTITAALNVQNASIRSLRIALPVTAPDQRKTVRASSEVVSDFVPTAPDSDIWELQFKRRVVGKIQFRIEFERRGERSQDRETIMPLSLPDARQLFYYVALRAGGRLELALDPPQAGWQSTQWNRVPQTLRAQSSDKMGTRQAATTVVRGVSPTTSMSVQTKRQSLAEALKLRVAQGELTTVLSANGDQLTSVQLTMDVIQRSSLIVDLPDNSELLNLFVNGESVNSIRHDEGANRWQFYVLPGIDDQTANVRLVYSVMGDRINRMNLISPQLNVPLENIRWDVITPPGFELNDHDGSLELVGQTHQSSYDRSSYLSKVSGSQTQQAQQANELLNRANQLLRSGQQSKASWAFNCVANQYALDAASNEDARVQLQNLHTEQAIVGLQTRRQRLYLDNRRQGNIERENQQIRQAADNNPVLQQAKLNFRPQQITQVLRGNTTEDNQVLQRIASRLVAHQHSTQPAAASLQISLPEEGSIYQFSRSVQVAEDKPLELKLWLGRTAQVRSWRGILVLAALIGLVGIILLAKPPAPTINENHQP